MVKTRKHRFDIEIIKKFVKTENVNKYFWPRESKLAKQLLEKFPIDFLRFCPLPNFKLPSLAWFLTNDGKSFINNQYFEYKRINSYPTIQEVIDNSIEISASKVGEDLKINQKPKTLKDFLKMF